VAGVASRGEGRRARAIYTLAQRYVRLRSEVRLEAIEVR
jgi:hypothetical protein